MRMKDKVGLVTAAGSGMGRAGAVRFAREGASIAIVDRDVTALAETARLVEGAGGNVLSMVGDLRSDDFSRDIVSRTRDRFGRLDFLWNHVGTPGPALIEGLNVELLDLAIDLNMRSGLLTTTEAIPLLRVSHGAVLFTASTSGVVGSPVSPVYSMTKFGVIGLVRSLAKRYAPEGIRFNALAPGAVDTPMLRDFYARPDLSDAQKQDFDATLETRLKTFPMGRIATPDDIANAANSSDAQLRAAALSYVPGRSGDLVISPKAGWMFAGNGTTHGSATPDDQRVPILLYGFGIKPGKYDGAATPADIAPTLAYLAGVTLPNADGGPLKDALR